MKNTRILISHYGGPEELRVVEEECPEPKDGEVRVRVLAAGVALPDLMMRAGIPETPHLPFTPGWDLIGVVDRPGNGVSGIEPGQIVAALRISGAYTEFALPSEKATTVAVPRATPQFHNDTPWRRRCRHGRSFNVARELRSARFRRS